MREAEVRRALDAVLDPELDEPVTALGFVTDLAVAGGSVDVRFRLPTFWCSPNFAWIMAEDMRAAIGALPWVRRATVTLADHLHADRINRAVNRGETFAAAFGAGDLSALRATFRRKAYLGRLSALVDALRAAGLADAAILALTLGDLRRAASAATDPHPASPSQGRIGGGPGDPPPSADVPLDAAIRRFLALRDALGGPAGDDAPAIRTPEGEDITEAALPTFLRGVRMLQRGVAANAEMCRIHLRERQRA